ncbi:MAG: ROK family protein [Acidimicrobiales bacterium]
MTTAPDGGAPAVPSRDAPDPAGDPAPVALAVDIGGTKMAAGLIDREGRLLVHRRAPTPRGASAEDLWATLVGVVDEVRVAGRDVDASEPTVCGVGCGGPMTAGGRTVSPVNIAGWRGFPLQPAWPSSPACPRWWTTTPRR